MQPDDIITPIRDLLPANTLVDNKEAFLASIKKEATFKPFGELVSQHIHGE